MKFEKSKIVAIHLLNDFSGSPLVFTQALDGLQQAGHKVILHTSGSRNGFLNRLQVPIIRFPYTFYANPLLRLAAFSFSQLFLFIQLLRYRKQDVIFYVNTLLPFGAGIAGALMGKKVIYHLHESYIRPALLKKFLRFVAGMSADTVVYVSGYLQREENIPGVKGQVIYNALPEEFTQRAGQFTYLSSGKESFTVLMICSLKEYKGIPEYIQLAQRHPQLRFELILNASPKEIAAYFKRVEIPYNLFLYPVQSNLDPFYRKANLVVNLTNPSLCVETFGMTLLEAMCYGIPVIAPPVGGPGEIVKNEFNGLCIDVRDQADLDFRLDYLAAHPEFLNTLSNGALETAKKFNTDTFKTEVLRTIQPVNNL